MFMNRTTVVMVATLLLSCLTRVFAQDAHDPRWQFAPSGALQCEIVRDGTPSVSFNTRAWGTNWQYFSFPQVEESNGVYRASINVPGTKSELNVRVHRAAADNVVALRYVFEAKKDIDLTGVAL